MSTEKYTIQSLLKKNLDQLKEIATGLTIPFADDVTKKELAQAILDEEEKLLAEIEDAKNSAKKNTPIQKTSVQKVEYSLPETSKGVIDIGGKKYDRESAIKNQALLARLKKAGHKAVFIVKK